ncbi:hypothetical protein SCLCIDRAFT_1209859 [Scleroderma citrinum Foug A]|uniref:Uncharacterized protein n=1 Tax=Scleroderma citrinum Foug A TaxID=1036808 RepID=A0A0C3EIK0_9AGAM|nr:hypothetical protein SCLCIDRAFT_1209859 [Scleroderma citrinum Foug A]
MPINVPDIPLICIQSPSQSDHSYDATITGESEESLVPVSGGRRRTISTKYILVHSKGQRT